MVLVCVGVTFGARFHVTHVMFEDHIGILRIFGVEVGEGGASRTGARATCSPESQINWPAAMVQLRNGRPEASADSTWSADCRGTQVTLISSAKEAKLA